jgi:hypothetical protein
LKLAEEGLSVGKVNWGWSPRWANKDAKRPAPINARVETVMTGKYFRNNLMLGLVRFFMATCVVVFHLTLLVPNIGMLAVNYFYVISGYLITMVLPLGCTFCASTNLRRA